MTRFSLFENSSRCSWSGFGPGLRALGYERVRQEGSHIRLPTQVNGPHHVTVPHHKPLKTGTLVGGVLKPVAAHHKLSVEELVRQLGL